MKFKYAVLAVAFMVATVFVLAVSRGWFRLLFMCEGFGCTGLGLVYAVISALVVFLFFVFGVLLGPVPRLSSGLFAAGVAVLAMAVSWGVLFVLNQSQIARDMENYEAACAQHPKLCPEKSLP